MLAIKNGKILTITKGVIEKGTILIKNGKILGLGQDIDIPQEATVIDAAGSYVAPGFIDAQTSIGLKEGGMRWEGADHVENTEPVLPQLRAIDGFNPEDVALEDALEAGVTVSNVSPGDLNVIGGISGGFKLAGTVADEMYLGEVAVKASLGELPKTLTQGKKMPATRMGTAALLRENLLKAKTYARKKQKSQEDPEKDFKVDLKMESLARVLNKELPMHVHAHRADDIMTAIRIAKEYDINIVLVHAYEAHKVSRYIKENNIPVIYGPIFSARWQVETSQLNMETPALLVKEGIKVALTTAHPAKPIHLLPLCSALAVREGLDKNEALKSVTINAAQILGYEDRVGSIEEGKDADLVIMDGHPLQLMSKVQYTIIDGDIVYQGE